MQIAVKLISDYFCILKHHHHHHHSEPYRPMVVGSVKKHIPGNQFWRGPEGVQDSRIVM